MSGFDSFRISECAQAFSAFVREMFLAYDEMGPSERRRLVDRVSSMDFRSAVDLVLDKSSLRKARLDNPVVRGVVYDERSGMSFETVEGFMDEGSQDLVRGIGGDKQQENRE